MTLEEGYFITQILASVAVVVSVLFLARQVRENTATTRANSNKDASLGWSEFNAMMSQHPACEAFSKTFDLRATLSDFPESDQRVFSFLGRALMQRFESEYFQFSAGLLHGEEWEAHRRWCASFLQYPVWKIWWETESRQILYTQSFLDNIKAAKTIPVTAGGILRATGEADSP